MQNIKVTRSKGIFKSTLFGNKKDRTSMDSLSLITLNFNLEFI